MPGNKVKPREHQSSISSVGDQGCKAKCFRRATPGPKNDIELKVERFEISQFSKSNFFYVVKT